MTAWEHGDEYPNDKLRTEGGMKKNERALWMWVGGGRPGRSCSGAHLVLRWRPGEDGQGGRRLVWSIR